MREKIQDDLKKALKSKNAVEVSTLRLLIAAIINFEISRGEAGYKAKDEEIVGVVQKEVKQRNESVKAYKAGDRQDLADKETKELQILEKYLPKQMSEEEIAKSVEEVIKQTNASSPADMGKVMGILSSKLKGKADMGAVSGAVKRLLGS